MLSLCTYVSAFIECVCGITQNSLFLKIITCAMFHCETSSSLLQVARARWLGRWSERIDREPDFKDEQAVMDFMREKYEKKRWYVEDPVSKDAQQDANKGGSLGKPPQREKKGVASVSCDAVCMAIVGLV